jgi:hypothetical protein
MRNTCRRRKPCSRFYLRTTRIHPEQTLFLPAGDQVILTIRNDEPWSGQAGDPKPDWLGWGAQAFAWRGGEFWILDSAAEPQRLFQLVPDVPASREDILRRAISLEGKVVGAADLEIYGESVWVLDIASMPPRVVQINDRTGTVESFDLPEGLRLENGLSGIALNPGGVLLVELQGGAKVYRLFDEAGQIAPEQDYYIFQGQTYSVELQQFAKSGWVKSERGSVEVRVDKTLGGLRVLGAAPDGSFYVEVFEMEEGPTISGRREVRRYSAAGELVGVAFPLASAVYAEHDLLVNPDGNLYQLVSNEDHSVQIVKLGFRSDVVPTMEPAPTPTPAILTPLLPDSMELAEDADDPELARYALVSFFTFLHDGRYAEAAPLYGGPYDVIRDNNPDIPEDDYAALWQAVCTHQTLCLSVARIVDEKVVAQDEFEFVIEFIWRDGTLFKLGPCCGATEAEMPPVWQFPYTVKKIEGKFQVMEGPVYMP